MALLTILLQQTGTPQGSPWGSILTMVALVAIFYFFMIRPQTKKKFENFVILYLLGIRLLLLGEFMEK